MCETKVRKNVTCLDGVLEDVVEEPVGDGAHPVGEGVEVPLAGKDSQVDDDNDQGGQAEDGHDLGKQVSVRVVHVGQGERPPRDALHLNCCDKILVALKYGGFSLWTYCFEVHHVNDVSFVWGFLN